MAKKSITVHYRRLSDEINAFNGNALEASIREAMEHKIEGQPLSQVWRNRAWTNGEDTLLMNLWHDDGGSFFGDLTQYSRGFMQALLQEQPNVPSLPVEQQPAPEGKEYIHSMMYWLAKGNHMLVIQSQSLTSKQLEQYLTWLLKDHAEVIDHTGHVILNAKFDSDEVGGDLEDIKEIIVGGTTAPIAPDPPPEPQERREREVEVYREVAARKPWHERAMDVLRAVMTNEADVQELLDAIPEEADLQVDVHIGYKTRKRKVSRAPLQQALRNLPEGELTAIGKGGRMTGKDVRLSFPVRVAVDGSLLNPEDARAKLMSAYTYFVENGKIEP